MKKILLCAALLLVALVTSSAEAHWGGGHWHGGHWHGGHGHGGHGHHGHWHGGWGGHSHQGHWHHAHWHGGGWRGGGWNAGWGSPWGWSGGWGSNVWTRRTVVFYPQTFVQPSPVFYSSPGFGGCGWSGGGGWIDPGFVSAGAPAVYAPAGIAYGPDAMKEFMGVDRDFAKGPLVAAREPIIVERPAAAGARIVADKPRVEARVTSHPEAKARAERHISFGDVQFGEQLYHAAAQRYREAVAAAPDVADAHFRQGFAYIASNRFDLAARSFRRGLEIDPLWVNSSFRVDELYGANRLAKDAHLEGLARGALANRTSGDHLFLVGLMLHFDGQTERAKKFFARAEKLSAEDDAHIAAFLVPAAPAVKDAI